MENTPAREPYSPDDFNQVKRDLAALKAFELPSEPDKLREAVRGKPINAENILWLRSLSQEERDLLENGRFVIGPSGRPEAF